MKDSSNRACNTPIKGHYADNGVAKACTNIIVDVGATSTWIVGAAETATDCDFSCTAGFVKSGRTCKIPDQGHYAKSGVATVCTPITGGGFDDFVANKGAVSTPNGCVFSCTAGYVNNAAGRTCDIPDKGHYADNGVAKACTDITVDVGATSTWIVGAASTATGCDFSCTAGYVKDAVADTCNIPDPGKYADNGVAKACSDITVDAGATSTWIAGAASTATGCDFSCTTGFVKTGRACNIPDTGEYADNGVAKTCSGIMGDPGGFAAFADNKGAVTSAAGCGFSCNLGYLKNTDDRECNYPSSGNYVDTDGVQKGCDAVGSTPAGGFDVFVDNTKAVPKATDCSFSCKTGYVKSVSAYSCNQAVACVIAITNGKGQKPWNSQTNTYDACEVVDCDAGYDNTQAPTTQCQLTASRFYSLANNKDREPCPSTPAHSTAVAGAGLLSAAGCYSCDDGYLKNTITNTCDVPLKGKYVNTGGIEASCLPITVQGTAVATWIPGAASTDATCPFSCTAGFVKTGRACNIPIKGHYADSGVETDCTPITGGGFADFDANRAAVTSAAGCGFSCTAGFVKTGRACNTPITGHYANSGVETDCTPIRGDSGGFAAFAVNNAAVTSADGCGFSCNAGFVKNTADRTCNIPDTGEYADNGVAKDCTDISGVIAGFAAFDVNAGAVTTAAGCDFSCKTGYVKSGRACNYPTVGKYVNNLHVQGPCDVDSVTSDAGATSTWIAGDASTDATCPFSCTAGFVMDSLARACKTPSTGHYANSGVETDCSDITGDIGGFAAFEANAGAVTSATGCGFSCNLGYLKNTDDRECNYPSSGHYADTNGAQQSCDKVSGTPPGGFDVFVDNTKAVPTATDCSFSCKTGYVKSVSVYSCNKAVACVITNGQGQKPWNSQTNTYDACEVVDCNAGFDNTQAPTTQCQPTASRYYSLANRKDRVACPSTPAHSTDVVSTGLSSAGACFTCNAAGHDNTKDPAKCEPTAAEFYSLANSNTRTSCPTPANSSPTSTTGLFSTVGCFTCDGGHDNTKDPTKCQPTAAEFYSLANSNTRTPCPAPSGSTPTSTTGLSSGRLFYL